jgi:hypothetical protein
MQQQTQCIDENVALLAFDRFCHASRQPAHWRRGVSFRRIGAR